MDEGGRGRLFFASESRERRLEAHQQPPRGRKIDRKKEGKSNEAQSEPRTVPLVHEYQTGRRPQMAAVQQIDTPLPHGRLGAFFVGPLWAR